MKKLLLFIFCAVLSIGARAQFSGSGAGTESDPYRIYTEVHLAQMANFLNQEGVVFELMKDLDLSNYIAENYLSQGWAPIGVESAPFKGMLKGNGHTIKGLYINRPNTDNIGLFGYANGIKVENLTIVASSVNGRNSVGVLCGNTYGSCTIENVSVSILDKASALCDLGGIVGYMHEGSTLSGCTVTGKLETSSGSTLGCGTVGGIGGTVYKANVVNCTYTGEVKGSNKYAGGIIGSIHACTLTNCSAKCDVTAEESVGGISGVACETNKISECSHTGNVNGTQNVSGGVGLLQAGSLDTFTNCHHKGTITNTGDYTGGIVGKSEGACIAGMESCSHFGDIDGKDCVGGIIGAIVTFNQTTPHLIKYETKYGSYSGTRIGGGGADPSTYYDVIEDSNSGSGGLINNCSSIGNITASDYVGGIVGKDQPSYGYTGTRMQIDVGYFRVQQKWSQGATYNYVNVNLFYEVYADGSNQGRLSSQYLTINKYIKQSSSATYKNNLYSGSIKGKSYIGGLVGSKESGKLICNFTNSYLSGVSNVGGLVGEIYGREGSMYISEVKSNVLCISNISASEGNVGRIYGNKKNEYVILGTTGTQECNRALTQTSIMLCGVAQDIVDDEQNGTSVGPSMLKLKGNYVSWGWNFDDNWNILETECYPYKKYQAAPPVIESKLQSHDTSISGKSLDGGTVYMFYKDRNAVSTTCSGNNWEFTTEELQSGAQVQLYADVEGMTPSYFTTALVKYPGSGTEEDPYRIYSAEDLRGATNSGYFLVMNDIDLTSWINDNSPTEGWQAIGRNSTAATYINGDGHTVKGLWINATQGYNALFSNYSAGYIKNLNVEVAEGKSVKGGDYTGILIGRMANGQIINCNIKGAVEGTTNVGGVAGYVENASLTNNTYDGSVTTSSENAFAGGVTGFAKNVQTKTNIVTATINSTGNTSCVGGLFGKAENGTIANCHANANISAAGSGDYVGGLVGYLQTPVTQSYSEGTVTATGENSYTGGLVGMAKVAIDNSYSTANTNGTLYTTGLVGYTYSSIDRCYAQGDVRGEQYGAGVVGELDGASATLTNSMALNNLVDLTSQSAWGCRVIGGFKNGAAEPTMGNNYALKTMQVSLNGVPQKKTDDNIEGVAKTAEELKEESTYRALGWDFDETWEIKEGSSFPYISSSFFVPTEGSGEVNTTDISLYDNIVYVEDGVAKKGVNTMLSVKLNNKEEVTGFKFNLVLPKGITVAKDEDDFYLIDLSTERTTTKKTDYFDSEKQSDGSILVTCKSTRNYAFSGNEGEVATIVVKADSQIADDDYAITLRDVELTFVNGGTEKIDNVVSVLTIGEKKVCEAPVISFSNGKIVCTSATEGAICHHTYKIADEGEDKDPDNVKIVISAYAMADGLKNSKTVTKTFDFNASGGIVGDVDGDGKVSIADANAIVNMYLNK